MENKIETLQQIIDREQRERDYNKWETTRDFFTSALKNVTGEDYRFTYPEQLVVCYSGIKLYPYGHSEYCVWYEYPPQYRNFLIKLFLFRQKGFINTKKQLFEVLERYNKLINKQK
jgi:hypothetical protein